MKDDTEEWWKIHNYRSEQEKKLYEYAIHLKDNNKYVFDR